MFDASIRSDAGMSLEKDDEAICVVTLLYADNAAMDPRLASSVTKVHFDKGCTMNFGFVVAVWKRWDVGLEEKLMSTSVAHIDLTNEWQSVGGVGDGDIKVFVGCKASLGDEVGARHSNIVTERKVTSQNRLRTLFWFREGARGIPNVKCAPLPPIFLLRQTTMYERQEDPMDDRQEDPMEDPMDDQDDDHNLNVSRAGSVYLDAEDHNLNVSRAGSVYLDAEDHNSNASRAGSVYLDADDHNSNASRAESVRLDPDDNSENGPMSAQTTPRPLHSKLPTNPAAFALSSGRNGPRHPIHSQVPTTSHFGVSSFLGPPDSIRARSTDPRARPGPSTGVPPAFQAQGHYTFSDAFSRGLPRLGPITRHHRDINMDMVLGSNPWEESSVLDPDSPLNQTNALVTPTPKRPKVFKDLEPEPIYPLPTQRVRQANATLVKMNSNYRTELNNHLDPTGTFQKGLLATFRADAESMLNTVQQEHEQRMRKLEHDYEVKEKELEAKAKELHAEAERLKRESEAKMEVEQQQQQVSMREQQENDLRRAEELETVKALIARQVEEANERITQELEDEKAKAADQERRRVALEQEIEEARRAKRQTEKLLTDRLEEFQAKKDEEIAAAIQRQNRMNSGKERNKASSSTMGTKGPANKGKEREVSDEGPPSNKSASTKPPHRDQNRQPPDSTEIRPEDVDDCEPPEDEVLDKRPKPQCRQTQGLSWAAIKSKKSKQYAQERPVLEASEAVDEDVDMSEPEENSNETDDGESDDERDDDEAPLAKGALKKLLREVLKGQTKRGGRKSDTTRGRRSKVDPVEEEKKMDQKWERTSYCRLVGTVMKEMFGVQSVEEYAVHEPAESRHVRLFDREEKDGPDEDDLRIDMRGKISSSWNTRVMEILLDAVLERKRKGTAWDDLPDRSDDYLMEIIQVQLERARTTWRNAQPKLLESGEVESLNEVEKRMIESKEVTEKMKRANMRRIHRHDRRVETIKRTIERKRDEGATDIAIWEWLETLVTQLGPEGMSSDESDIDDNTGTEVLYVRSLNWRRSAEKELDFIDKQRRTDRELFSNKGSKPTLRLRKSGYGNTRRNPPKGKSKSLFDKHFLANYKNAKSLKLKKGDGETLQWLNIGVHSMSKK
ncbi:hypothetical protein GALMADRAFT_1364983 [Galerina marginata CBS 339.88]|uniref:Uncharacterized protein n=1 Tax=Galerina marginata (strain CBS 339.88) TaxID=685588 RepID=A0A067TFK2_GALM3|nr:hypothetical protein GALMADRAFT_1364983 [Galerina marginata CBS 339.88]